MASRRDTVDYLMDQIAGAGRVSARKMFGEYAIYCSGKVVALVCDDRLFVKPTVAGRALIDAPREGPIQAPGRIWSSTATCGKTLTGWPISSA